MHETAVQRTLKRSGITKIGRKNRLVVTKEHEEKRSNLVKNWKDYTFEDAWITDECVFQLHRKIVQVWSSKKYPTPTKAVLKFDQKILGLGNTFLSWFYLDSQIYSHFSSISPLC